MHHLNVSFCQVHQTSYLSVSFIWVSRCSSVLFCTCLHHPFQQPYFHAMDQTCALLPCIWMLFAMNVFAVHNFVLMWTCVDVDIYCYYAYSGAPETKRWELRNWLIDYRAHYLSFLKISNTFNLEKYQESKCLKTLKLNNGMWIF